jgi:four helix bundle protein
VGWWESEKVGGNPVERKKVIRHYRDLEVYQKAFESAMRIYQITKDFPPDEKHSLVDQIRRSSRSVCSNLAEGWRKRRYPAAFKNKLTDAMQEASETQCWLEFSLACSYLHNEHFKQLDAEYESVQSMLNVMEKSADKFCY